MALILTCDGCNLAAKSTATPSDQGWVRYDLCPACAKSWRLMLNVEHLDLPVEALDLSERPRNCLRRVAIQTVGELVARTPANLLDIANFGANCLTEVEASLDELGFELAPDD